MDSLANRLEYISTDHSNIPMAARARERHITNVQGEQKHNTIYMSNSQQNAVLC